MRLQLSKTEAVVIGGLDCRQDVVRFAFSHNGSAVQNKPQQKHFKRDLAVSALQRSGTCEGHQTHG